MAFARTRTLSLQPTDGVTIAPVSAGVPRPAISVIVPAFEPNHLLIDALTSVLRQDPGPEQMQIAVVDDASTNDIADLVAQVAPPNRVEIYRVPKNQGLAGNWNESIRVARGKIVHLLHQDDWVAEGFYARVQQGFARHANVGLAFCRHAIVEGSNRVVRYSHRERLRAGVLRGWLEKIGERQRIQCASALVRRDVYEQLGGYRSDLCYALDWEMWVRIAARFEVWYEPRKLAFYRRHESSETNRLSNDNKANLDVVKAIGIFSAHLPSSMRPEVTHAAYARFVRSELKRMRKTASPQGFDLVERFAPVKSAIDRLGAVPQLAERLANETARQMRYAVAEFIEQSYNLDASMPAMKVIAEATINSSAPLIWRTKLPPSIANKHDEVGLVAALSIGCVKDAEYGGLGLLRRDDDVFAPPEYFPDYLGRMARESLQQTGGDIWHGALFAKNRSQIVVDEPVLAPLHPNLVYGHFLLEILPRLLFIDEWDATGAPLALSTESPAWVRGIVTASVPRRKIIWFDSRTHTLIAPAFIVPSTMQGWGHHLLHPEMRRQILRLKEKLNVTGTRPAKRRLYLSRTRQVGGWHGLADEGRVAEVFGKFGFDIVHPQELSFRQQVALFDEAAVIAGEYSSALHNSLFARPGCRIFSINWINWHQSRICTLMDQEVAYFPTANGEFLDWSTRERGNVQIDVDCAKLAAALEDFLHASESNRPQQ